LSIQIIYDPLEKTELKYKYAVFGQWLNRIPKEVTPDGTLLAKSTGVDLIAERPLEDGSIMYYRKTKEDIAQLLEWLRREGVTETKILTEEFWLTSGNCKNKPASEGGGCENVDCSGSCTYCEPGHYCCC
jgi:hypothetical protein